VLVLTLTVIVLVVGQKVHQCFRVQGKTVGEY